MRTDGITFIVPNWNHELVLSRAVRSGIRAGQELRAHDLNVEVMVVDDASRDGSPVLLRQLEALYYRHGVRVLALQQNSGPSTARNLALTKATYRYVIFMDADNEIVPENVHHFYRSIRDTEAAVVYGNILIYDLHGTEFCSHESYQTRMFGLNYIDTFSLADAEQLLDVKAFWPDARNVWEDWELYLHLAACGRRMVHVPMVFGLYYRTVMSRIHEGSNNQSAANLIQRIYRQFPEVRDNFKLNTKHLRYHPAVGYL